MRRYFVYLFISFFLLIGCGSIQDNHEATLPSPDFDIHLYFNLFKGYPYYLVYYKDQVVVSWSWLGFDTAGDIPLNRNLLLADPEDEQSNAMDVIGDTSFFIRDGRSNSLTVKLVSEADPSAAYFIDFITFEGGVAFRYRLGDSAGARSMNLEEATEFNFSSPDMDWQISNSVDSSKNSPRYFRTPFELISDDGYTVRIFEDINPAQPGMTLKQPDHGEPRFSAAAAWRGPAGQPWEARIRTPWRVILISKSDTDE